MVQSTSDSCGGIRQRFDSNPAVYHLDYSQTSPQQPFSPVLKVAVVERFDCSLNGTLQDYYQTRYEYSRTSLQRPPWGQRKVAVLERWPLWGERGVIYHLSLFGGATFLTQKYAYCYNKVYYRLSHDVVTEM